MARGTRYGETQSEEKRKLVVAVTHVNGSGHLQTVTEKQK